MTATATPDSAVDDQVLDALDFDHVPSCEGDDCPAHNPPATWVETISLPCGCSNRWLICSACYMREIVLCNRSSPQMVCFSCRGRFPGRLLDFIRFEPIR